MAPLGWQYYNPNPRGKRVGDCSTRALAKAITGDDWYAAFAMKVAESAFRCDETDADDVWGACLRRHGWRRYVIPNECPDCYTVRDFCRDHPTGIYILCPAQHVVCAENGDWFDSWDSGDTVPMWYWAPLEGDGQEKT